jgi:2'-hydroxyisoflavone reductase
MQSSRMSVLVLGGTQFVGRHIVEALLQARHTVTILNRGQSTDELPAEVGRLHGDRDHGLAGLRALSGRTWDACIDVSGTDWPCQRATLSAAQRGHRCALSASRAAGDPAAFQSAQAPLVAAAPV